MRAWLKTGRGEHIESLTAWVVVVATNLGRSWLRRRRAERRARLRLAARAPREAGDRVEEAFTVAGRLDFAGALEALPRRQREAIVLHYYLDLSVADLSRALGVSEGTVKVSLHRGRARLSQILDDPIERGGEHQHAEP